MSRLTGCFRTSRLFRRFLVSRGRRDYFHKNSPSVSTLRQRTCTLCPCDCLSPLFSPPPSLSPACWLARFFLLHPLFLSGCLSVPPSGHSSLPPLTPPHPTPPHPTPPLSDQDEVDVHAGVRPLLRLLPAGRGSNSGTKRSKHRPAEPAEWPAVTACGVRAARLQLDRAACGSS
jgi:hypothetical protein